MQLLEVGLDSLVDKGVLERGSFFIIALALHECMNDKFASRTEFEFCVELGVSE